MTKYYNNKGLPADKPKIDGNLPFTARDYPFPMPDAASGSDTPSREKSKTVPGIDSKATRDPGMPRSYPHDD